MRSKKSYQKYHSKRRKTFKRRNTLKRRKSLKRKNNTSRRRKSMMKRGGRPRAQPSSEVQEQREAAQVAHTLTMADERERTEAEQKIDIYIERSKQNESNECYEESEKSLKLAKSFAVGNKKNEIRNLLEKLKVRKTPYITAAEATAPQQATSATPANKVTGKIQVAVFKLKNTWFKNTYVKLLLYYIDKRFETSWFTIKELKDWASWSGWSNIDIFSKILDIVISEFSYGKTTTTGEKRKIKYFLSYLNFVFKNKEVNITNTFKRFDNYLKHSLQRQELIPDGLENGYEDIEQSTGTNPTAKISTSKLEEFRSYVDS